MYQSPTIDIILTQKET